MAISRYKKENVINNNDADYKKISSSIPNNNSLIDVNIKRICENKP